MRLGVLVGLAASAVAACYSAPTEPRCTITCTSDCPDDLACVNGYCVSGSDDCTPTQPPPPTTVVAVAVGADFACALDDQHARWCWGHNDQHQVDPSSAPTFVHPVQGAASEPAWDTIAAGRDHACGLAGGELWCWGGNAHGQIDGNVTTSIASPEQIMVAGVASWTTVAPGVDMTCAIGDGRLFCWGRDDFGQLGDGGGGGLDIGAPVEVVGGLTDWTAVATNELHTCAVSTSTGVLCWGGNVGEDLGSASVGMSSLVPVVALPPPATLVAVTRDSSCATSGSDASLWCWGDNTYGQLGELNTTSPGSSTPVQATLTTGWTRLSGGAFSLCGLAGSDAICWGTAPGGGLASGVWNGFVEWDHVLAGASDVATGDFARELVPTDDPYDLDLACGVVAGAAACWGDNRFGQLAQGGATMATTPQPVAGGHAFTELATGADHACALDAGSNAWCWGSTEYGATTTVVTGNSGTHQFSRSPCRAGLACDLGVPTAVAFADGASAVSTGDRHTCALVAGDVSCWGNNEQGQLGADDPPQPKQRSVAQPDGPWATLAPAGDVSQCATDASGHVYCWGGEIIQASTATAEPQFDNTSEFLFEPTFGCALDASGYMSCYGDDSAGEDGDGMSPQGTCGDMYCAPQEDETICPEDCPGPLRSAGRPYVAIALSPTGAACGVTVASIGNERVECWGVNTYGQTGEPTSSGPTFSPYAQPNLMGCTAVALGDFHSCALCSGAVWCWGDDEVGQLGDGTVRATPVTTPYEALMPAADPSDPWVEVHAGTAYTCARSTLGSVACWGFSARGALGNGALGANMPQPIKLP